MNLINVGPIKFVGLPVTGGDPGIQFHLFEEGPGFVDGGFHKLGTYPDIGLLG